MEIDVLESHSVKTMSFFSDAAKTEFGYVPSLALFEKPSVNSGILGTKWIQYRPNSQVSSDGVIQFNISGNSDYYVDLKSSFLQIKGYICRTGTDKAITDEDEVTFENIPLQSLWNQVDLSFQQKVVNAKTNINYSYKAYLDVLLNSSNSEMINQLTSQLFFKDDAQYFDKSFNSGRLLRKMYTAGRTEVEMQGPLYLDISQQGRVILNGIEINLKLWPNKPAFYLSSSTGQQYYFKITDAIYHACMAEISPAILVGHAAALKEGPALYPYLQSDLKVYSIPMGHYDYTIDNIFSGEIPSDLVVGLVSSKAYTGSFDKNPFNFHNYDCSLCGFYINGVSTPARPYEPIYHNSNAPPKNRGKRSISTDDSNPPPKKRGRRAIPTNPPSERSTPAEPTPTDPPSERDLENLPPSERGEGASIVPVTPEKSVGNSAYLNSYLGLFGQNYHSATNIPISVREYPFGYCLYKFQISENSAEGENGFVSIPRRGHTRLIFKFRKPLPESVSVILYAHFPRILQIDEARNVTI